MLIQTGVFASYSFRPRSLVAVIVFSIAILIGHLAGPPVAMAQAGGLPPLPFVLEGRVYVDEELLDRDAVLSVRIDTWESRPVDVIDGRYQRLIVGPPDSSYIGKDVNFYLDGVVSPGNGFVFVSLSEPRFEPRDLFFGIRNDGQSDSRTDADRASTDADGNDVAGDDGLKATSGPASEETGGNVRSEDVITSGTPWTLVGVAVTLAVIVLLLLLRRLGRRNR